MLIDVGVGRIIEEWLKLQDFTIISIGKLNPEMPDTEILELAEKEKAVIITMDKDFGELVFKNHKPHHGVFLLRLEDALAEEKISCNSKYISRPFTKKMKNNFAVYQNGKLRIRIIK